jgi:hypothetical protein
LDVLGVVSCGLFDSLYFTCLNFERGHPRRTITTTEFSSKITEFIRSEMLVQRLEDSQGREKVDHIAVTIYQEVLCFYVAGYPSVLQRKSWMEDVNFWFKENKVSEQGVLSLLVLFTYSTHF